MTTSQEGVWVILLQDLALAAHWLSCLGIPMTGWRAEICLVHTWAHQALTSLLGNLVLWCWPLLNMGWKEGFIPPMYFQWSPSFFFFSGAASTVSGFGSCTCHDLPCFSVCSTCREIWSILHLIAWFYQPQVWGWPGYHGDSLELHLDLQGVGRGLVSEWFEREAKDCMLHSHCGFCVEPA